MADSILMRFSPLLSGFSLFPCEAALGSTKKFTFPLPTCSLKAKIVYKGEGRLQGSICLALTAIHLPFSKPPSSPFHCWAVVGLWLYRQRADKNKLRLMEETAIALVCFFVTCWAEAVFTLWNVTKKSKVITQVHLSVSLLQLLLRSTMRWQGIYCWWLVISCIIGNISTV